MKNSRFARLNRVVLMLAGMVLTAPLLATGDKGNLIGTPTPMGMGITETVATIMARDAEATAQGEEEEAAPNPSPYAGRERAQNPMSPLVATYPITAPQAQFGTPVSYTPQALGPVSFTGGTLLDSGFVPPDTMGAAGPKQFIVAVNGLMRSFNKSTGVADGALNTSTDNFFASVRNASTSDPRIRFDRLTQKWYVIMIDVGAPNRILIAVSSGPIISAQSSFTFFQFTQDAVPPTGDTGCLMDYPSIGIDINAIYIGGNQFPNGNAACTAFAGGVAFVVRKSSVQGSGPIVVSAFRGLTGTNPNSCPSTGGDSVTPQGVDNDDPSATNGYFVADSNCSFGIVNIRRVGNPGGTPTLTADMPLTVPMNDVPLKVEHLGNNHPGGTFNGKIDGNDNRPIQSRIVSGSLYTTQGVACGATGVSDPNTPGADDRDCVRFYEVDSLDTTPNLVQAGTIFDSTGVNPLFFTYGSMAVSGQGHAAFSFSSIGAASYANGATTGRLASDPLGFTYTPTLNVTAATVPYDPTFDTGTSRARRWGDFSAISVDPDDNMTMWGVSEYTDSASNGGSWGVRVNQLLAPPPAAPTGASTASGGQGSIVNTTVTGASSSGSGFFDPGAGFPKHISASVSGGNVSVVSTTYVDPITVNLQLAIANAAVTGPRDITITNPDGQSATGTGIFSVTGGACSGNALATSPDAVLPGGSVGGSYSEQFSVTGGGGPFTFSSGGTLPAGTGLTAGGSLSGTLTADGVYNFSITASDGACDVVQGYSVTVNTNYLSVQSGTPQTTWTTLAFGQPLKAQVVDGFGNPVGGVTVTFTAPGSGASGTFPGNATFATAITDATFGVATAPTFTANNTVGSYAVAATISTSPTPVNFNLSNLAPEIVTNTNDSGPGSLRQVLSDAPSGATVNFQAGLSGTITLTSGQLSINNSVSIPAPGARTLTVSGNNASRVFSVGAVTASISGLTITGGKAAGGAGIQNNGGTLALTDVAIVGNVDIDGNVGTAIDNENGNVTVLRCTIANNTIAAPATSTSSRGAIMNRALGNLTTMVVTNSTITGNSAGAGNGGALRNLIGSGTANANFTAINSTITNNSAGGTGGNIARGSGNVTLQNTIVAGGAGPSAANGPDISGTVISNDYNLIQKTSGATIIGTTTHNITGVDPQLGALANNGGQTDTRMPAAGSPVIDQGGTGGPSTDQNGLSRPFDDPAVANSGDGSDIGAVESHGIFATGSASPVSGIVGTTSTFTVNVTSSLSPPSTGISVIANLTDFGGTATQAFTNQGGGVYTFSATVAASAALGAHAIPVSIADAQGRSGSTSIAFTVVNGGGTLAATTAATPNSVAPSDSTTLTVTVTPGTNPASTGLAVTADLSSIGGSASQAFLDDGVAPDVTAGDGIFTYSATVPLATAPGSKNLPVTISDSQSRTGSANIALTVLTPTSPSGTGAASPSSVAPSGSTVLTVTTTAGTNPASSSLAVTADLSSIGGSATQAFLDDGVAPDTTAGDGIFTYAASVPLATAPGSKSLPVTITDGESRTGSTNIALTVLTPGALSGTGSATPSSVAPSGTTVLKVTTVAGTNPASTSLAVKVDLSSIGGSATQAFLDDGVAPDTTAGDGIFTYSASVPLATAPGNYSLPATITDAQSRSGSTNILLTVLTPGSLSGVGSATPASVAASGSTTLTVAVTPGTSPASTGIAVKADLSSIGGSATASFHDDGLNGDATAGDNIFSYTANVPLATAPGSKNFPVTITDGQSRTGSANIALTVLTPGSLSGSGSASPTSVAPTGTATLTVAVTPGTSPPSTGIAVKANLSSIGGSATQSFHDDGLNGDAVAGDNTFTYIATVPLNTTPGSKTFPVTITDAQSRTGTTNIGLTVLTSTALSATSSATPNSGIAGDASVFQVNVTSGTNPTSTGIAVTANLTDFGGTAAQAFTDNGGGSFSFNATVQNSAAPGLHVIPVSITDGQGRNASASIAFNVPAPGALSGAGLSVPGSVALAGSATLLVAVTPGTSPASSGLTVTANLAQIGGDVAQAFHDDGLNGDATAGDHIYTFVAPIGSTIALGTKLLPVTIGDAQSRSGTATIQINIVQGTEVIFANGFE